MADANRYLPQKTIMRISISNPLVREAVFLAYKGCCFYTGRAVKREIMVIDHLHPVSKGGEDSFYNYVLTFQDFNLGKSNKTDSELLPRLQYAVDTVYAPRAIKIYERIKLELNWGRSKIIKLGSE